MSTYGKNDSEVPKELVTLLKYVKEDNQIQNQQDLKVLKQWMQLAFQSKCLEEFSEKIK